MVFKEKFPQVFEVLGFKELNDVIVITAEACFY